MGGTGLRRQASPWVGAEPPSQSAGGPPRNAPMPPQNCGCGYAPRPHGTASRPRGGRGNSTAPTDCPLEGGSGGGGRPRRHPTL
eukprot:3592919-Heterocapsa_arctica.AAC.1